MVNLDLPLWETTLRLILSVVFGGFIGLERERRGKPAGLRTNMTISLGAATFTLMAVSLVPSSSAADPTRIVEGVATGIGFLGAGSILKSNGSVRGIRTAAGVWVVGAVGAACGVGAYSVAAIATGLTLVIFSLIGKVESSALELD